ncbi:MAG: hypothetical protein HFF93_02965 [Oscillibacter sp.]|uniref:GTP pyrophosphokinase n=1 Tax=uncultured Oscillibacter sp. TaxID=876091 RepID=UPI00216F4F46|nr:hypothetical protein [uncultured Oscillibacter sp.]MCI9460794.1 hypothetical protein [Oscillibacter sp.]
MSNKTAVLTQYDQQRKKYERFAREVEHQLRCILEEEGIVCNAITSRVKERDSLTQKIDVKSDKYKSLSEVTDIAGIRIITYYDSDVERAAKIVEREFCVDKENSINKREALGPEKFGYCSVHYVVSMNEDRLKLPENRGYAGIKCEIQIRTVLQHAWAEIEHDLGYKSEIDIPKDIRRSFSRLAGLLEVADKEFQEIRDFLETYREKVEAEISEKSDYGTPDCELDAVVLEAVLKTKPNFQELNRRIGEIAGMKIRVPAKQKDKQDYYGGTLQKLNCLGISTTAQLDQLAERGADLASYLADKFLRDRYKTEPEGATLPNTIGVFYLCYAQLILNNYSKERVVQYMENTSIGVLDERDPFVQNLLKYGREFAVQQ